MYTGFRELKQEMVFLSYIEIEMQSRKNLSSIPDQKEEAVIM